MLPSAINVGFKMTDWKTYKSQTPFQFIVAPSESYNEGNKIAFSPKIPGKSPVWGMDRSGIPITPTHTPCRYWTGEGWEWVTWLERICMGLQIDYDSTLMFAEEQQVLGIKDSNGDVVDVDVAVWFLTGVGSISADIGSSITYTAPSEVTGTDTAVIEMWCNGVVRDTLTISFAGKITYTTPQQPPGTNQVFNIDNPNPGCTYTWELTGGGSLSTYTGPTTTFTAPTTNPNCFNSTISLLCNGVVVSTVEIAVNIITGDAYIIDSNCHREDRTSPDCYIRYRKTRSFYKCDGTFSRLEELGIYGIATGYRDDCVAWGEAICQAYCNRYYGQSCCSFDSDCSPYQPMCALKDTRTAAQIAAGCCPAALI